MFLGKKTLLKIWLNPGLNLTIFRGTEPSSIYSIFASGVEQLTETKNSNQI